MGTLVRAIAQRGGAVCYAIDSTDLVHEAEQIHQTSAVVTAALGRLMTAASMMGAMLKGEEDSITLRITADGAIGSVLAVSDAQGNTKGYVTNPVVELPLKPNGKLDVSGALGEQGMLYVIRDSGAGQPYVGLVPLVSGEIAEDITHYFATSEQTATVCALGVLVNPDLTVQAAGGYLLQLLPGAAEEDIAAIEASVQAMPPVTTLLAQGVTAQDIALRALEGLEPELLDSRTVEFRCNCDRARVERALISLGAGELEAMAREDGKAEVSCHFCHKQYQFTKSEILALAGQNDG